MIYDSIINTFTCIFTGISLYYIIQINANMNFMNIFKIKKLKMVFYKLNDWDKYILCLFSYRDDIFIEYNDPLIIKTDISNPKLQMSLYSQLENINRVYFNNYNVIDTLYKEIFRDPEHQEYHYIYYVTFNKSLKHIINEYINENNLTQINLEKILLK